MKKKRMTFGEFKMQVNELYEAFSQHCTWTELRVWDGVPGDTLKIRDCWYAIMKVNDTCHMMVQFSPDDDDPKPYTCWYDYMCPDAGTVNYSHWNFATLEEAMHFCMREPLREYQNEYYCYAIKREVVNLHGVHDYQRRLHTSFIEAYDFLMSVKDSDRWPEGEWTVYRWKSPLGRLATEPMYALKAGKYPNCNWFFQILFDQDVPDYIFTPLTKE